MYQQWVGEDNHYGTPWSWRRVLHMSRHRLFGTSSRVCRRRWHNLSHRFSLPGVCGSLRNRGGQRRAFWWLQALSSSRCLPALGGYYRLLARPPSQTARFVGTCPNEYSMKYLSRLAPDSRRRLAISSVLLRFALSITTCHTGLTQNQLNVWGSCECRRKVKMNETTLKTKPKLAFSWVVKCGALDRSPRSLQFRFCVDNCQPSLSFPIIWFLSFGFVPKELA